jgi:hypothetical protein
VSQQAEDTTKEWWKEDPIEELLQQMSFILLAARSFKGRGEKKGQTRVDSSQGHPDLPNGVALLFN